MAHKLGSGAILGIASEDGVVAQKRITLMDRSNMKVIKQTVSDEFGAYAMTGLNPDTNEYLIFAVDDDGDTKKAAIMYDYVQPIPAHQGGFFWSNWYLLAMSKEPVAMFLAIPDEDDANFSLPYGVGRYDTTKVGGSLSIVNEALVAGAPNLPSVKVTNSNMARALLNQQKWTASSNNIKSSCEWLLDTSKTTSVATICVTYANTNFMHQLYQGSDPNVYLCPVFMLEYDPSTYTVRLYRHDQTTSNIYDELRARLVVAATYVLPVVLRGTAIHITSNLEYAIDASLYINGVSVVSNSLIGTNSSITPAGNNPLNTTSGNMLAIVGNGSPVGGYQTLNTGYTNLSTPLFCVYSEAISSAEVLARYNALTKDVLPLASGYVRSSVEDYPLYLFRLDDNDGSNIAKDTLRFKAINAASALNKALPNGIRLSPEKSMMIGGSGMDFDGGGLRGNYMFGAPVSPRFITVSFTARPNAAYVNTRQSIVSHLNASGTSFFEVGITNAGKWRLQWRSASEKSVEFTTPIDTLATHFYAFTISIKALEAKLYIDGALVETITIVSGNFDQVLQRTIQIEPLCIAGFVSEDGTSVTSPYRGFLSDVAMYPTVLSSNKIYAQYESMSVI